MFYVILNSTIIFNATTLAAASSFVLANTDLYREGDKIEIAQVVRTGTVTVTVVVS